MQECLGEIGGSWWGSSGIFNFHNEMMILYEGLHVFTCLGFNSNCFPNESEDIFPSSEGEEEREWKIILFLSFHIFHTMNPGRNFHMRSKIGI